MNNISAFTLGLVLAGAVLLAGLAVYSWWQGRQAKPLRAEPEPEAEFERREPVLDIEPLDLAHLSAQQPSGPMLDALIDVLVVLELETPLYGQAMLAHTPSTRRIGSKPLGLEGLEQQTQQWQPLHPQARYSALQAGVQLANRSGALNEIEYSEFVVTVQAFADALGATPEFPDMAHEVARARELDQFASAHDAQLSLNLLARGAAWSPGYVQQQAAKLGFVPGVLPGRLVLPAAQAGAPALLSLNFDAQLAMAADPQQQAFKTCKLVLEVTHVPRAEQAFVRMREVAAALQRSMDAALADDTGQLLSADALDLIGADLERLYEALDSRDLSAGSPQARRLFS